MPRDERSDYDDDEPEDREPRRPRRAPPPKSGFPWKIVLIAAGILSCGCCVGSVGIGYLIKTRIDDTRVRSFNNLRQVCLALHNCNDTFQEVPLVTGRWKDVPRQQAVPRSLHFCLLPFVEQNNLYRQLLSNPGGNSNVPVMTYVDPDDATGNGAQGECNYAANWQLFGYEKGGATMATPMPAYAAIPRSFPDGTSNTVVFTEIFQNCNGTVRRWGETGPAADPVTSYSTPAFNRQRTVNPKVLNGELDLFQLAPKQSACTPSQAQSQSSRHILVGLGDGSARKMASSISLNTWRQACAPADGQPLGGDW